MNISALSQMGNEETMAATTADDDEMRATTLAALQHPDEETLEVLAESVRLAT